MLLITSVRLFLLDFWRGTNPADRQMINPVLSYAYMLCGEYILVLNPVYTKLNTATAPFTANLARDKAYGAIYVYSVCRSIAY